MRKIRAATPRCGEVLWTNASALSTREDYLNGDRVRAASVTLFPTGCEHAARGGCTMCGEWAGSNLGNRVCSEFHVAQFAAACAKLLSEEDIRWLRIYVEGSFLNDREIAPEAREVILRMASSFREIRRITIESRPEYITNAQVSSARACTRSSIELEIGIGLEAKNDFIRNICIEKATSLAAYRQAVNVIHANGIVALAYVLLKPPFVSERGAIEEAVESVAYAFEIGFDEVYVQASSIHEWSLSELLMLKGLYSPPWLWSVLEVVKRTAHLGKVKIGGLEYFPPPSKVSQNYQDIDSRLSCSCSEGIWHLIGEYNATHDADLLTKATCACRRIWQSLSMVADTNLPSQISHVLSMISVEEYIRYKHDHSNAPYPCKLH
jgi:radical SAM enzyme (TIGR01210 family)